MHHAPLKIVVKKITQKVNAFLLLILATLLLTQAALWYEQRDALANAAYEDYAECMQERAGMNPSAFYLKYGYHAECY